MRPAVRRHGQARGMTLIEVVMVLAILGAVATILATTLILGAQGFLASSTDVEIAQRARLAANRLTYEMKRLTAVSNAQASTMTFTDKDGANAVVALAGGNITLNGNLLLENLAAYTGGANFLAYTQADGVTAWTTAAPISQLAAVTIVLLVIREGDPALGAVTQTFTATINPRNTGTANAPSP